MKNHPRLSSFAAPLLLVCVAAPLPMFVRPEAAPIERIIKNLQARLAKAPKDPHLVYTLARAHYLSFTNQTALIPVVYETKDSKRPAPDFLANGFLSQLRNDEARRLVLARLKLDPSRPMDAAQRSRYAKERDAEYQRLQKAGWIPKPLSAAALKERAQTAMNLFDRAINLAPDNGLYHLGRASLAEQVLQAVADKKLDKPLPGVSEPVARDWYFTAFRLSIKADEAKGSIPIEGLEGLVSHEAGQAFLRLAGRIKGAVSDKDRARMLKVRQGIADLRNLRPGPITPVLLGRHAGSRLADLLDPAASVHFDLDGDGVEELWPWVQPDTGILVWAPAGTRSIDSGRRLFGSVTFFLFHRDGYEALALLDDDGDGVLRGLELDGLAVWYDRNGDGRGPAAELQSVWDAGIVEIATTAADRDGRAPMNPVGVRYQDGRIVPTIDWITERR